MRRDAPGPRGAGARFFILPGTVSGDRSLVEAGQRSLEGGVPLADVLRGGVRLGSLEDRGEARAGPQLRDATLRYYMMMIAHDGMTKRKLMAIEKEMKGEDFKKARTACRL